MFGEGTLQTPSEMDLTIYGLSLEDLVRDGGGSTGVE
jgi:hypothetical protein